MALSSYHKYFQHYFQIVLGCFLVCMGFNVFLIPAHLLTGGLSGVALIGYYLTGLPVGAQNFVLNIPILYLAYKVFGRWYAIDTIVGTFVLSFILDATAFLIDWHITQDSMLCALFGGLISGIGFGIVFRTNANTGGLDVIAAVVKRYYSIDVGTVVFILNFIIILSSVFMFSVNEALFSLINIYVTAEFTNRIVAGFNREKSIVIISPQADAICQEIMEHVHRGVTYIEGRGGFAKEHKDILYVVVKLRQVSRVQAIVNHYDAQAFMIVSDASEVKGKGFTIACESYQDAKRKWEEAQEKQKHMMNGQS